VARRYDWQHTLLTLRSDERCRRRVVELGVRCGDRRILDAGAGTGLTARLAVEKVCPEATLVLVDLSTGMLSQARKRFSSHSNAPKVMFVLGDIVHLPLHSGTFDAVLSTFSACPLYDPAEGAREMIRLLRPGGRLAIAHSAEPRQAALRWLAQRVEALVWRFPSLSLGCRPVDLRPVLTELGARVIFDRLYGVPLWPFRVLVVEVEDGP
jgi:demethylmenaquinone methyltransferase/2-methoxy-6-polyprenyl-1,4-benzoquinol methylase